MCTVFGNADCLLVAKINGTYSSEAPSVTASMLRDIVVSPKKIGQHSLNISENTQVWSLKIYARQILKAFLLPYNDDIVDNPFISLLVPCVVSACQLS